MRLRTCDCRFQRRFRINWSFEPIEVGVLYTRSVLQVRQECQSTAYSERSRRRRRDRVENPLMGLRKRKVRRVDEPGTRGNRLKVRSNQQPGSGGPQNRMASHFDFPLSFGLPFCLRVPNPFILGNRYRSHQLSDAILLLVQALGAVEVLETSFPALAFPSSNRIFGAIIVLALGSLVSRLIRNLVTPSWVRAKLRSVLVGFTG